MAKGLISKTLILPSTNVDWDDGGCVVTVFLLMVHWQSKQVMIKKKLNKWKTFIEFLETYFFNAIRLWTSY